MEQLKMMKDQLTSLVQGQLANVQNVDTKELGEAVDMIKDLEEAIYYCTVVKAMEETDKNGYGKKEYYTEYRPYERMRPYENPMYYDGGNRGHATPSYMGGRDYYTPSPEVVPVHDYREGRSPMSRKMYMESKELHKDKATQLKELEKYMKELSMDITELIQNASVEERQMLKQKLTALAEKVM